jgi:putative transposase
LAVLLRREGHPVNHKLIHRLYREDRLEVTRRRKKRTAATRTPLAAPTRPNQRLSLAFVSDAFADVRKLRALTLVDAFARELLAIEVDTPLAGERVVPVFERRIVSRGWPTVPIVDNGPEVAGNPWIS